MDPKKYSEEEYDDTQDNGDDEEKASVVTRDSDEDIEKAKAEHEEKMEKEAERLAEADQAARDEAFVHPVVPGGWGAGGTSKAAKTGAGQATPRTGAVTMTKETVFPQRAESDETVARSPRSGKKSSSAKKPSLKKPR